MSKKDTVSKVGDFSVSNFVIDVTHVPERKITFEDSPVVVYNSTVKLQSQIDARINYTGQVTGKQYYWARAGSVESVDSLDAPYLLEKRIQSHSCCSGTDVAIFIKID